MRAGWVLLFLLCWAPALHALEVQVGSSFIISGVTRPAGQVELPLQRGQYANVRILSKETYDFVRTCTMPCRQALPVAAPAVSQVRSAASRPGMWIADVLFGAGWQVTFLVFQKGDEFTLKPPEHFKFLDSGLETSTRQAVVQAVQEETK